MNSVKGPKNPMQSPGADPSARSLGSSRGNLQGRDGRLRTLLLMGLDRRRRERRSVGGTGLAPFLVLPVTTIPCPVNG